MSAYISATLKRRVRERFNNRCAYCLTAEELTATQFEIEHIEPLATGGKSGFSNLCLSCPMCNRFKSDSSTAVDPSDGSAVPLFHPHLQQWREHFRWSEDGTEVVGLSPTGRGTIVTLRMNRPAMLRVRRMWVAMSEHPPQDN
jgi:hypothetical protein